MENYKIIQDPLNGPIKVQGVFEELIDSEYFQRLRYVKQLGLCFLVFPGANHSRFEHSLGAYHLSNFYSEHLDLRDRDILAASALLHDIGHPPLSHSLEDYFEENYGLSHLEAGVRMIRGVEPFSDSTIPDILEKYSIDPLVVSEIITGHSKEYDLLSKIISGPIDVDELDYLRRDSMFCGVAMGLIDHRRIINISAVDEGDIVIEEKGIPSIESLLISRVLMYNSVYFHKTCRISQKMLEYALEEFLGRFENPFTMGDQQFLEKLREDGSSGKFINKILKRKLYKRVIQTRYEPEVYELMNDVIKDLIEITEHDYIIDVIPPLSFAGKERLKTGLLVYKDGIKSELEAVSPLVRALYETLENRTIIVSAPQEMFEPISNALKVVL